MEKREFTPIARRVIYCECCRVVPVGVEPSYCEGCLGWMLSDMVSLWGKEEDKDHFSWDKVDDSYLAQLEITEDNLNYGRLGS